MGKAVRAYDEMMVISSKAQHDNPVLLSKSLMAIQRGRTKHDWLKLSQKGRASLTYHRNRNPTEIQLRTFCRNFEYLRKYY